jgi:Na+-translocating ferredoxin:NAD+ oxidoreductase RnfE subunit
MNCESVLTILMGIAGFIKLIRELMLLAQQEFGAGTGDQKKSAVLDGLSAIVGNDTVWDKVRGLFGIIIDTLAIFKAK